MLKDDQKSLKVVVITKNTKTLCQTTVHVAAPFDEPNIEINPRNMMATCKTKGGFPKPEVLWISTDHEGHERTLEPADVQTPEIHQEGDGTYRVISTANITGSKKVTCRVHNPTSNQTLSKDVTPLQYSSAGSIWIVSVVPVAFILVLVVAGLIYRVRRNGQSGSSPLICRWKARQNSNGPI